VIEAWLARFSTLIAGAARRIESLSHRAAATSRHLGASAPEAALCKSLKFNDLHLNEAVRVQQCPLSADCRTLDG
jgi:hypothetical protein